MVGTRSEDTLVFLGLTPKIVKFKPLYKVLTDFALKKQSLDFSDRFNIILFQESGPIYLNDFSLSFDNILKLWKDYEKKIVRANVAGGIFVAITFIIDVYQKISDKAFRLIILTDRGSLKIPDYYVPVLYDLIDKVKDMPLYIDILRLGTKDYEEDAKLDKLARRANGRIFEIKAPKDLVESMMKLAEKKTYSEEPYFASSYAKGISPENKPFYENLAASPKMLVSLETCSICFQKNEKMVVQCPNCDTIAHMVCWANWAKMTHIGMPYVFRCHNCFTLIKLDKGFVEIVQEGKDPAPEVETKKRDLMSYLQELEAKNVPEVVQAEDPLGISEDSLEDIETEETFEPFDLTAIPELPAIETTEEFIKFSSAQPTELQSIPTSNKVESPAPSQLERIPFSNEVKEIETSEPAKPENIPFRTEVKDPESTPQLPQPIREPPPIPEPTKLSPAERRRRRRLDGTVSVVFCPSCSGITTSMEKYCPTCGNRLK